MQTNSPDLWLSQFPRPKLDGHKYDRGHCIVIGGEKLSGAARLAAMGAARIGAGLTTLVAPKSVANIYRETLPAHIMVEDEILPDRCDQLQDPRRNALVLGPGMGPDAALVLSWLGSRAGQKLVLDADGLNAIAKRPEGLKLLREGDVLTPHEGEFERVFPDLKGDKTLRAAEAARETRTVIVLKGNETIITDGTQMVTNTVDAPYLASAGTGDVLAGMIGGLLAQGMPSFEAACAAVWIHGEAGKAIGPGLVASDLPDAIHTVLGEIA